MQKGTAITGALVDDEVLDSSKSILAPSRFGLGQKGAQQFYSPSELSRLAYAVVQSEAATLDPTAGDGSLLNAFPIEFRYGVEIDRDQIAEACGEIVEDRHGNEYRQQNPRRYEAIQGDLQQVFPLLEAVCPPWHVIVANPPFGLTWQDPTVNGGKPTNSAVVTMNYVQRLLDPDQGEWLFVCGRDQWDREIAQIAGGVYAIVECPDLFEDTQHPSVFAFGVHPGIHQGQEPERRECPRSMIDLLETWVRDLRERHTHAPTYSHDRYNRHTRKTAWEAAAAEYKRRQEATQKKKDAATTEFNLELFGGNHVNVNLDAFTRLTLHNKGSLSAVEGAHNRPISAFILNERDWLQIVELAEQGLVTIQPKLREAVDKELLEQKKLVVPMYPIKPQQRLGFLTDLDRIKCIKDDPTRGFVAGQWYDLKTRTIAIETTDVRAVTLKSGKNKGKVEDRQYTKKYRVMRIQVGHHRFTDSQQAEDQLDIAWFADHFEIRDPGDIATLYPEAIEAERQRLDRIQAEYLEPRGFKLKAFQREDVARLLFKGKGLLAWQQGLGKTLGGLTFAKACIDRGAQEAVLVVTPKDLIPQWIREAKRFYGIELKRIDGEGYGSSRNRGGNKKGKCIQAEAKAISDHLKGGGTGWYITHYEALAIAGLNLSEKLPEMVVFEKMVPKLVRKRGWHPSIRTKDEGGAIIDRRPATKEEIRQAADEGRYLPEDWFQDEWTEIPKQYTSKTHCPACHGDYRQGWNGTYCENELPNGSTCGYAHFKYKVRPAGSFLSTAFKKGVIIVDEGTFIQGDSAKRALAVRGMRARHKLLMTGTPIKNYVGQAFWLLWWAVGGRGAGERLFPFTADQKDKFEQEFSVMEWFVGPDGKKGATVPTGEITNLSKLWRLLASSVIRRRKEETGEQIVPATYHEMRVPLGTGQRNQMDTWLKKFPKWFIDTHPESNIKSETVAELWAPMIGLNVKLDYAASIPEADTDDSKMIGLEPTNYTPSAFKALQVAMALAKQGRKVILGSNLVATSAWMAQQLNAKGVNAVHLLDANEQTVEAERRAGIIQAFQEGEAQVLCAGVKAIRLGHNLDKASAIICHGLDWDWESFDQFVQRAWRLTSTRAIDIYVIVPEGSITAKKWENLTIKGSSANLALDGRLIENQEERVDEADIIREMMEKGIEPTGNEIPEDEIEALWEAIPQLDEFEIPESLLAADDSFTVDVSPTHESADPHPWTVWTAVFGDTTEKVLALPPAGQTSEAHWHPNALLGERVGLFNDEFAPAVFQAGWITPDPEPEAQPKPDPEVAIATCDPDPVSCDFGDDPFDHDYAAVETADPALIQAVNKEPQLALF